MCIYVIKKYFKKFQNYLFSSIMSIYYEIPRQKIDKYIKYQEKTKYISLIIFNNDIDKIIISYIIGDYKTLKINNNKYPILKDYFYSSFINKKFFLKKNIINLKFDEDPNSYVIDFILVIMLLYPGPLILTLYNVTNDNVITTITNDTIHPNRTSYKILKYNDDFIDQRLFNFTLNDFHHFIRIMNIFKREDFNVLYEYILENSENFSNNTLLKNIKIY